MTNGNDLIHSDPKTFGATKLGGGLTKREYFAALALQGQMAAESEEQGFGPDYARNDSGGWIKGDDGKCVVLRPAEPKYAERAIALADALIEALNKETRP